MKTINIYKKLIKLIAFVLTMVSVVACDLNEDLPEEGSIEDLTPPQALFAASQNETDYLLYNFANLSSSATDFQWDFGDGNTSTDLDATNTFPAEGTYTVTLTASDKLGKTSTYSEEIVVVEPEVPQAITPAIGAADFEDGNDVCGTGDSRDCWRISGGKIHQTTSDGRNGTRGAKYPAAASNDARVTYQAVTVSPNTKYVFTLYYAIQEDGDSVKASIIDGALENYDEFASATILGSSEGTVNGGKGNFNAIIIEFETGASGEISMLFEAGEANAKDSYIDDVSIVPAG
ncbi:PKD domain-containing protein [Joostella sp. CR20]|uniref:PKD domain-containing protein n=1 Tax=Joostella sp. CR20 TaxID=2804312 RepID=UPI00313D4085